MLKELFGNNTIEKICFFLLMNKTCYGALLSKVFDVPVSSIQKGLERLEYGGIVVSVMVGKTRVYQFNPRWPFLKEFEMFLKKAYSFLPEEMRLQYYERPIRKRPRRKGKPL